MRPAKPLVLALWILAAVSVAGYAYLRYARPSAPAADVGIQVVDGSEPNPDAPLPVLFPAPDFQLTDQHGESFPSEELEGKVWIGFIFLTNCPTGACPVMVNKMGQLQAALPDERVHFVSFSVDPERDTPEVLSKYAREVGGAEVSDRWHLLTGGSREQMSDLARSMKLVVDENFGHSTVFLLVDKQGNVRGTFGNEDPEGMPRLRTAVRNVLAEE